MAFLVPHGHYKTAWGAKLAGLAYSVSCVKLLYNILVSLALP